MNTFIGICLVIVMGSLAIFLPSLLYIVLKTLWQLASDR